MADTKKMTNQNRLIKVMESAYKQNGTNTWTNESLQQASNDAWGGKSHYMELVQVAYAIDRLREKGIVTTIERGNRNRLSTFTLTKYVEVVEGDEIEPEFVKSEPDIECTRDHVDSPTVQRALDIQGETIFKNGWKHGFKEGFSEGYTAALSVNVACNVQGH